MVFWGIEISPAKQYTHQYNDYKGKLHISQATLGSSSSTGKSSEKSSVQCKVGNESPVLLCSLLPGKIESCVLNLEFEEKTDVVFSVVGHRSIHLTGYYLGPGQHIFYESDDTNSYGEDIAESESDESSDYDSEEDEYEDDFIDDDEYERFPPSPRPKPNSGVIIEEIVDDEKPENRNGTRKRLKKHQRSDSDYNDGSQQLPVIKSPTTVVLESEDEDGFPVSFKSESNETVNIVETEGKQDRMTAKEGSGREKAEDDINPAKLKRKIDGVVRVGEQERGVEQASDSLVPSSEVGDENGGKLLKKKKVKAKKARVNLTDKIEERTNEDQNQTIDDSMFENAKIHDMGHNLTVSEAPEEKISNDEEQIDRTASSGTVLENSGNLKKKKKEKMKNKAIQATADSKSTFSISKVENMDQDMVDKDQGSDIKLSDNGSKKKKMKKSKTNENGSEKGKHESIEEIEEPQQSLKARTFSNGLIIEELSMGKPDGKRASPGNKVSVHYIGKLKKNGEIFDSNIGTRPFKFRLGIGEVIKGWDVGVNGMRVGDKRRLIIPPSMGYGAKRTGKIPENSWLVFDVELVDVK